MCAFVLKGGVTKESRIMLHIKTFYENTLTWALNHTKTMLFVLLITFVLNIFLFVISPKGFFPQQDTGRIVGALVADQNISFKELNKKLQNYVSIIKEDSAVEHVVGFILGNVNTSTIFIVLKPLKERGVSAWEVMDRLREKVSVISGSAFYMQVGQDLVVGGRSGNAQYQYTISGIDIEEVNKYAPLIMQELKKIPGIIDLNSDQQSNGLQSFVNIDYDKAANLGVDVADLDTSLYTAFGQNSVSMMYKDDNQYYEVATLNRTVNFK
jgi:multidrug efflux pump